MSGYITDGARAEIARVDRRLDLLDRRLRRMGHSLKTIERVDARMKWVSRQSLTIGGLVISDLITRFYQAK